MKSKILKKVLILVSLSLLTISMVSCNSKSTAGESNDNFDEKKITIGNGENNLDGILTIPKDVEKPPVVILVHGSGISDMDETISKNKPFKDIAKGLAEKGIATIRYNKRFYQYPVTSPENITIQYEVLNDVNFAIDLALNTEELNKDKIYVLGHSLGGMLVPEIAKNNEEVKGIISLAGSPRKFEDIILTQNEMGLKEMTNLSQEEKEKLLKEVENEVNKVEALNPNEKAEPIMGINSEYWVSLNNINTPEIVKSLDIPMLFLQGEEDFQVYSDIDFKAWQDILTGHDNATFKLYPNLNHLFMKSNGKKDLTEYEIKSNVDSTVISDIANWVNQ